MGNIAKRLNDEFQGSDVPTVLVDEVENQTSSPGSSFGEGAAALPESPDFNDFSFAQHVDISLQESNEALEGGSFGSFDLDQFVDSENSEHSNANETVSAMPEETESGMGDYDPTNASAFSGGMQATDLSGIIGDDPRLAFAATQEAVSDASGLSSEREFESPDLEALQGHQEAPSEGITAFGVEPNAVAPVQEGGSENSEAEDNAPESMGFLDPDPVIGGQNLGGSFPPELSFVGSPVTFAPPPVVKPPGRFQSSRFGSVLYRFRGAGTAVLVAVVVVTATVLAAPLLVSEENLRGFAAEHQLEGLFESLGMISQVEGFGTAASSSTAGVTGNDAPAVGGAPVASKPAGVETPPVVQKTFEANREYFSRITDALQQGDPEKSAAYMNQPPSKPLESAFDFDAAAMAAARFYLFVGRVPEALRVIEERCGKRSAESMSAEHCLPLVRAYLSMGRAKDASAAFTKVSAAPDASEQTERLQILKSALAYAQQLSPRGIADHLLEFLQQTSTDVEWERQQGFWILESLARLGHGRWSDFAQIVFKTDRAKFLKALSGVSIEGGRFRNSLALTRFLDYLAARFGYDVLGFQHGNRNYGLNDYRLSVAFQALSANMVADSGDLTVLLHRLRDKKPFGEVERLIKLNLALQENRWTTAYQILNSQVPSLPQARFGFEWKLAGALFAIGSNNVPLAKNLYTALQLYGARTPSVTKSFDYWHIVARLGQFTGTDVTSEMDRAESLAASERERGLVAALRLKADSARGSNAEADIETYVNRFPWHDSVLSAAILASGRAGKDPSRYMKMQDRITVGRLAAGREKNLLLDSTVEELLRFL